MIGTTKRRRNAVENRFDVADVKIAHPSCSCEALTHNASGGRGWFHLAARSRRRQVEEGGFIANPNKEEFGVSCKAVGDLPSELQYRTRLGKAVLFHLRIGQQWADFNFPMCGGVRF